MNFQSACLLLALFNGVTSYSRRTPLGKLPSLSNEISAESDLGRSLLSQARRLDENNGNDDAAQQQQDDDEVDMTWIKDYSLKFQGCRHHTTVNLDADDENDVRIKTVRMAHFRLCPSNSCATWLGGGCNSNYGDYVVDLETFAESYIEGQRRAEEYQCQMYMWEHCDCEDSDDKGDDFNRDYCEYDCYSKSKNMASTCIDRNPYEEEEEGQREERFEAQRYVECNEWEQESDDDGGNNGDDDANQVQYYMGAYCSDNGGSVYLGLFTDDTCTNFADSNNGRTTYKTLSGSELPYGTTSLIRADCVSCLRQEDPNRRQEGDDDQVEEEEDQVADQCERLYETAGKCEAHVSNLSSDANNEACSYIGGIRFTKLNGVVDQSKARRSKTASVFIGIFACVFIGLAALNYTLREKLRAASNDPLLDKTEEKPAEEATLS